MRAMRSKLPRRRRIVARGGAAYGINTGFGLLAKTRIADDQLHQLQRNLIYSHSVGVGELLTEQIVRLALAMKIGSLARGFSGVRPAIIDALLALYNANIMSGTKPYPAATSTASRSRSRPIRWLWRSRRSARYPSVASRC